MIYKPEEQSLLQPLHHYMSCHRSEPLSLQHLLFCWQLQSSNFSSCSDTTSISSALHGLSERHETWCLCSTAQRLPLKPCRESSTWPATAEPSIVMPVTNSPLNHLSSNLSLTFLLVWTMRWMDYFHTLLQLWEICIQILGIYRAHEEQTTGRFPGSQEAPCQHNTQSPSL